MGGVTRTDRKRRSTTFTAGPNAAAGASRSRSGTLANGGAIQLGGASSASALGVASASLLQPTLSSMQQSPSQLTANSSLPYGHPQQSYNVSHPLGAQLHALSPMSTMPLQSSLSSASLSNLSSAGSLPSSTAGVSLSVNSNLPNNSPLAMKELSPTIKPVIEEYLLRYLNHLCMNRRFFISLLSFIFPPRPFCSIYHPSRPLPTCSSFPKLLRTTYLPPYHGARG
ncbi:hypothetical protein PIIN_03703 [Serendipita indica DSM 11827]|uniref:Uncharacterized protein n=1 Tax=Serendipita indica (strain DSM 11827) TaxID=1109443 RepID=G4TEM0_SERID|nr:hypothetical protein PIIN_03703 [Serendipita indica DSM 11827]